MRQCEIVREKKEKFLRGEKSGSHARICDCRQKTEGAESLGEQRREGAAPSYIGFSSHLSPPGNICVPGPKIGDTPRPRSSRGLAEGVSSWEKKLVICPNAFQNALDSSRWTAVKQTLQKFAKRRRTSFARSAVLQKNWSHGCPSVSGGQISGGVNWAGIACPFTFAKI